MIPLWLKIAYTAIVAVILPLQTLLAWAVLPVTWLFTAKEAGKNLPLY